MLQQPTNPADNTFFAETFDIFDTTSESVKETTITEHEMVVALFSYKPQYVFNAAFSPIRRCV